MRSLPIHTPHQILFCDQIENNEMSGACSMYGGEERCMQGFGGKNLKERGHLVDPDIDGRIILRWIFRKWNEGHGLD